MPVGAAMPRRSRRRVWTPRPSASSIAALTVALPAAGWVLLAAWHAKHAMVGRDQGIFQYVAWAIAHGARDYVDVDDINGPLVHLIHLTFLKLGGAAEGRFRALDLLTTFSSFAVCGACLPGLVRPRAVTWRDRIAWGAATAVVLGAQYLLYTYWDLAQRDSFADVLLLPAIGLQLLAQGNDGSRGQPRAGSRAFWILIASGALSVLTWFDKPTFAAFTLAQLASIAYAGARCGRRRAFAAFAWGATAAVASQIAFVAIVGSVPAFLRAYLVEGPILYLPIWPHTGSEILSRSGFPNWAPAAVVFSVLGFGLVAIRRLPRRMVLLALAPLAAVAHVVAQRKAFPYHFHPLTATLYLAMLALLVCLAEHRASSAVVVVGAAALLSLQVTDELVASSPHLRPTWTAVEGSWGDGPRPRMADEFRRAGFYPFEVAEAARFVAEHTPADGRVFVYGTDPYLLFLAGRLSAVPYLYPLQLDIGVALRDSPGLSPARVAAMRRIRDHDAGDVAARLRASPPAACVLIDRAPFLSNEDAGADLAAQIPDAAREIARRYEERATFGPVHVWLPREGPVQGRP